MKKLEISRENLKDSRSLESKSMSIELISLDV